MNIAAFNVRGLGSFNKGREIIKSHKIDVIGLTDSKLMEVDKSRIVSPNHDGNTFNVLDKIQKEGGQQSQGLLPQQIGIVPLESYMENIHQQSRREFIDFKASLDIPMLLIGDFNQVTHFSKRKGHTRTNPGISVFNEWINQNAFVNLPLNGSKFTWNRANMHSRIDRCLCDAQCLHEFPPISLSTVNNSISDHQVLC